MEDDKTLLLIRLERKEVIKSYIFSPERIKKVLDTL